MPQTKEIPSGGSVSPEEYRAFYGDLSHEQVMSKAQTFAQMVLSDNYTEAEMERWLQEQAVGFVDREFIAIIGTGLLTEEVAQEFNKAIQAIKEGPMDSEVLEILRQIEAVTPQIENELVLKGQEERLENLERRIREFGQEHGLKS